MFSKFDDDPLIGQYGDDLSFIVRGCGFFVVCKVSSQPAKVFANFMFV